MIKTLIPIPRPREEEDRILYSDAVIAELKQLTKLLEKQLSIEELSARTAMPKRELKKVLKLLGVNDA